MNRGLSILITDDHSIVREGMKQILMETVDLAMVREAKDGQDMLRQCRECAFDLVLLDISMPGLSGVEAIRELKRIRPALPVLVFTMHPEEQFAVRVIRAGASGYLSKSCAPAELVAAVTQVGRGLRYITPSLADRLATEISSGARGDLSRARPPHERLSNREHQVLCALGMGRSNREIAAALGLSVKTVNTLRQRTLAKMGMRNNAELIRYAVEAGLARTATDEPPSLSTPFA